GIRTRGAEGGRRDGEGEPADHVAVRVEHGEAVRTGRQAGGDCELVPARRAHDALAEVGGRGEYQPCTCSLARDAPTRTVIVAPTRAAVGPVTATVLATRARTRMSRGGA